jgi:hypothetical protein
MPYIEQLDRGWVQCTGDCERREAENIGQLTYVLYQECQKYLEEREGAIQSFADYAAVLGALEATKMELYRRKIAPYEDKKMKENGDVK